MRGGTIHSRTSFVILCNAFTKRNGQWATTYFLLYAYIDIFRWKSKELLTYNASINSLHADQLSNAISPQSCFFFNVVTSTFARHSLNARNVNNWERDFKENIIKKYVGERIRKEVAIKRIESYFSAFH